MWIACMDIQATQGWFQSLIGFWVVFGAKKYIEVDTGGVVSIPNRVLGGFRLPGSGWLEI